MFCVQFSSIHIPIPISFLCSTGIQVQQVPNLLNMEIESLALGDMLVKVVMFFLVQALVYLILSKSSNIFSKTVKRSNSFRPARSVSIRRILAFLSDLPPESEPSPSSKGPLSPVVGISNSE